MKIKTFVLSVLFFSPLTFSAANADTNCPSVQDIQNNALAFDTIYHPEAHISDDYTPFYEIGVAHTSSPLQFLGKDWKLISYHPGPSDDQSLQNARFDAASVTVLRSSMHAQRKGKFEVDLCLYANNESDGSFSQTNILAIHTKGKAPHASKTNLSQYIKMTA